MAFKPKPLKKPIRVRKGEVIVSGKRPNYIEAAAKLIQILRDRGPDFNREAALLVRLFRSGGEREQLLFSVATLAAQMANESREASKYLNDRYGHMQLRREQIEAQINDPKDKIG
jgi:hypothetical protein